MEEKKRNKLDRARQYQLAAEQEKKVIEAMLTKAEEKSFETCNQLDSCTNELREKQRQLEELEVCAGSFIESGSACILFQLPHVEGAFYLSQKVQ